MRSIAPKGRGADAGGAARSDELAYQESHSGSQQNQEKGEHTGQVSSRNASDDCASASKYLSQWTIRWRREWLVPTWVIDILRNNRIIPKEHFIVE
jgi:hypothetical protein